jgi:amino acid adenylation domain-containing protein
MATVIEYFILERRPFMAQTNLEMTALETASVPGCFAQTVAQHGGRLAVSAPAGEWSYQELDQRSDKIASEILARLGNRSEPVALLFEHNAPLIAAILGTLKANKMYVALEPAHPPELLSATLNRSEAQLLLGDAKNLSLANSIVSKKINVLSVADDSFTEHAEASFPEISGDNDAWLAFTSGSTGTPKGVWQNHRGLIQEGQAYAELAGITPKDRVSLLASCSLAASGSTLFATLLSGATLCLFHVRSQGVERLAHWLDDERITVFHTVPTIFRHLGRVNIKKNSFNEMRLVRLGGEAVLAGDVEIFRKHWPESCQLMQSLSSTETGIICASVINKDKALPNGRVSAGYPVRGVEIFLLDEKNQAVKDGAEGKMAVRSRRLKQGYWREPELTEEKFRSDEHDPNLRTFFSNDIGKFLPDGSLEHLGRADALVKIRGQRVDLGEVEAAMVGTGFAHEAVVVAHEDKPGEKRLVCFFVPRPGVDTENIRRELRVKMPEYMIPAEFVAIDKLPQTGAGKIDRAALRSPPPRRDGKITLGRSHRSRDVLDKRLMGIWESVLKISPISRKDDFFDLGGTSLQSIEVLRQIEELFGVSLPPSTLAEYNTIEKLSGLLAGQGVGYSQNILVKLREGSSGRPLFLIHSAHGDVASYGLLARRLTGSPVYGLQSVGLRGESWPLTDLSAMARRYLQEILAQDPTGPYMLAGTCMGGMVAFELAQMLVRQGKTVSFLGLLDAGLPLPKTWQKPWWHKIYYRLSAPVHDGWQALRWKTVRALGLGQSDRFLPGYRRFVARVNGRAMRDYKPDIYPGKVTLFITVDTHFDTEDPRLMMVPLAETAQVVKIPGERSGLFRKPAVDELAQQLQSVIEMSEKEALHL